MSQVTPGVRTSHTYGWKHCLLAVACIALGTLGVVEGARAFSRRPCAGTYLPQAGGMGKKTTITEGKISVGVFLQYLANYTGLCVILGDDEPHLAHQEITMAADIPEADDDVVTAILEVNRVKVSRKRTCAGTNILTVSIMAPTVSVPTGRIVSSREVES